MSSPDDDPFAPTLLPSDRAITPASKRGAGDPMAEGGAAGVAYLTPEQPDRYEMREELGRGGMGRVILAFDDHLGREIAMKELHPQGPGSSPSADVSVGLVTRFLREARVTGQLEHPNIVPVHELGRRADGTIYYTMKRIRGRSLASVLKTAKTLDARLELLTHFRRVCEAMAYAHARGVVHRDLKPDNVMVGEFGETLIVDWGLAKVRGEDDPKAREIERRVQVSQNDGAASTIDGHAIGTPAYMSPEQARGDLGQIDERSDIWGLGAMLFELLTGRPPHDGAKAVEVLQKVIDERPPRVLDIEPRSPRELAAIADRALLRDPSSRYPDAGELAREIVAFQDGRVVHAYDYSSLEVIRRFVARNKAASVAAVAIVLAIALSTLVASQSYLRQRERRTIAESRRDEAVTQREEAERETRETRASLAQALLDHAETALAAGDPGAAAIYAAGALVHDPANPSSRSYVDLERVGDPERLARERVARAFSAYLDGQDAQRFVFVRRVEGASARGALAPDGRTLVFPAGAQLVVESAEGGERRALELDVTDVLGFLDRDRVVVSGATPGVYALADGRLLFALPAGTHAASIGADRFAVALADGTILAYASVGYEELGTFELRGHDDSELAWSGEALVVGGRGQSNVAIGPWPPGPTRASIELASVARVMRVSPSGALVALGLADPVITVLTTASLEASASIEADGRVTGLAWLGDDTLAAAEGSDRVVLYNLASGARIDTLHTPAALASRLATVGSRSLLVALPEQPTRQIARASVFRFERHRQRRTRPIDSSVSDVRVDARRGRVLVATLRSIESYPSTPTGLGARQAVAPVPNDLGHTVRIAVARDGAIAGITDRGALYLVEREEHEVHVLVPASERTRCTPGLAFGLRGEVLYFGATDGRVRRWHRSRSEELRALQGHTDAVCGLSLSADGEALASASLDGTAHIRATGRAAEARTIQRSDTRFSDVAFAPSGEELALSDDGGFITVVGRADGRERHRFRAHEGWIDRIVWSPDGLHLATAGEDRTIRYFSADGARVERILRTSGSPRCLDISARGEFLYYQDASTVVRLSANPQVDGRDPAALLRIAEGRAGLRLDGLELLPAD